MKPKLSSDQESVIEELIQQSFGAQNLYVPERYKKTKGEDEPCDLIWANKDNVVLFYLKSGNKSLKQQDTHNLKQSLRWLKRWSSSQEITLKANNRFGDKLELKHSQIVRIVSISIVSHQTGIIFHKHHDSHKRGFTCTLPESLIHVIATFNGTVIDLLEIIYLFSLNPSRHLLDYRSTGSERLFIALNLHLKKLPAVIDRFHLAAEENSGDDIRFVSHLLGINRLPDPVGEIIDTSYTREKLVAFFGDMSAYDFLLLSAACIETIKATQNRKLTIFAKTQGMYLNWHIIAMTFRAQNSVEGVQNFLNSIKGTPSESLPQITFGHDFEGVDYRGPFMYVFPPRKGASQAEFIIERICVRINSVLTTY